MKETSKSDLKNSEIAAAINTLAAFCGTNDLPDLSKESLLKTFGIDQVDVAVLFGGSIPEGAVRFGEILKQNLARHTVIVGGEGHTTAALRALMQKELPETDCSHLCEAELFNQYLKKNTDCSTDYLETKSTNCGNNITNLLDLLETNGIHPKSILLMQDATMQKRMDAVLRKYHPDWTILNVPAYQARVTDQNGNLCFDEPSAVLFGMWPMDRYITLLMGEIPRLQDDENGYGPNGKGFLAHVDLPEDVQNAFEILKSVYEDQVRPANPLYATKAEGGSEGKN